MHRSIVICGLFLLIVPKLLAQQTGNRPVANDSGATNADNPSQATQYLRSFQTIHVETGTWLAKPEMCEGAIQKHREFENWNLSFVRVGGEVVLKIDHQPGWFYYQYSMVHRTSQVVLASGNVTAWDGKVACGRVADIIVARIKKARNTPKEKAEPKEQKSKKDKENESR